MCVIIRLEVERYTLPDTIILEGGSAMKLRRFISFLLMVMMLVDLSVGIIAEGMRAMSALPWA